MYPPKADDSHWVTINQIAAVIANVSAAGAAPGHGEAAAKPNPDPRAIRIIEVAIATSAPASTADQATAERPDSAPAVTDMPLRSGLRSGSIDAGSNAMTSPFGSQVNVDPCGLSVKSGECKKLEAG
jgi:hypothetical protein